MTSDGCVLDALGGDPERLFAEDGRAATGAKGAARAVGAVAKSAADSDPAPLHKSFSKTVQAALDYMNSNFASPITLRDLAEITDCSPAQIIRAFRRDVGITPHAWLIRRRVLQGKVLIELGVSIANAASEVGFFDQTHFTRHFKRLHGYTPARYRSTVWQVLNGDAPESKNADARRRG